MNGVRFSTAIIACTRLLIIPIDKFLDKWLKFFLLEHGKLCTALSVAVASAFVPAAGTVTLAVTKPRGGTLQNASAQTMP